MYKIHIGASNTYAGSDLLDFGHDFFSIHDTECRTGCFENQCWSRSRRMFLKSLTEYLNEQANILSIFTHVTFHPMPYKQITELFFHANHHVSNTWWNSFRFNLSKYICVSTA